MVAVTLFQYVKHVRVRVSVESLLRYLPQCLLGENGIQVMVVGHYFAQFVDVGTAIANHLLDTRRIIHGLVFQC